MKITINSVVGREIIDSRGNPTVEATVRTDRRNFCKCGSTVGSINRCL